MTIGLNRCGHGKTWAEDCLECEYITHSETVASFEPKVIHAKQRLDEIRRLLNMVCPNCDCPLPAGCIGTFKDDGQACWINKEQK